MANDTGIAPSTIGIYTPIGIILGFRFDDPLLLAFLFVFVCLFVAASVRTILGNYPRNDRFRYSKYLPDDTITVLVGIVAALVLIPTELVKKSLGASSVDSVQGLVLLTLLLPLFYFRAGYIVPHKLFMKYFGSILSVGLVGTLIILLSTGTSLWAVARAGLLTFQLPFPAALAYGTALSITTPAPVLAIMQDMNISEQVYILLYGEFTVGRATSLLLFFIFSRWQVSTATTPVLDFDIAGLGISLGVLSMDTVLEIAIGVTVSAMLCLLSRRAGKTPVMELALLVMAVAVTFFLCRQVFLVGAIALVVTGFMTTSYYVPNLSSKAASVSLDRNIGVIGTVFGSILYLLLGLLVVVAPWNVDWALLGFSFLFIYGYRIVVLTCITLLRNIVLGRFWTKKKYVMSLRTVLVMCYCGTRGEALFVLSLLLAPEPYFPRSQLLSNSLIVLLFNLFVQVPLSRVVLRILGTKKKQEPKSNDVTVQLLLDDALIMTRLLPQDDTISMETMARDEHLLDSVFNETKAAVQRHYQHLRSKTLVQTGLADPSAHISLILNSIDRIDRVARDYFELVMAAYEGAFEPEATEKREQLLALLRAPSAVIVKILVDGGIQYSAFGQQPILQGFPFLESWRSFLDLLVKYKVVAVDETNTAKPSKDFSRFHLIVLQRRCRMPRVIVWLHYADNNVLSAGHKIALLELLYALVRWELDFRDHVMREIEPSGDSFAAHVLAAGAQATAKSIRSLGHISRKRFKLGNVIAGIAQRVDALLRLLLIRPLNDNEKGFLLAIDYLQRLQMDQRQLKFHKSHLIGHGDSLERLRIREQHDVVCTRIQALETFITQQRASPDLNDKRIDIELSRKEDPFLSLLLGSKVYQSFVEQETGAPLESRPSISTISQDSELRELRSSTIFSVDANKDDKSTPWQSPVGSEKTVVQENDTTLVDIRIDTDPET